MIDMAKMLDQQILVVGDVMLDRYWWGDVTRISPEAPVPVVRIERSSLSAGGAANVAMNIAGLGSTPLLVGVIGDDREGAELPKLLTNAGVSPDGLLVAFDRPTTVKTRIVAHSQHVARVDVETTQKLRGEDEKRLIEKIDALMSTAAAIVISDYAKGVLSERVLESCIIGARERGITSIVDPKEKDFGKYRGATIVTPNKREAVEACGLDMADEKAVIEAGKRLRDRIGSSVLITEGENGMTLFVDGNEPLRIPASARDVFDVTGAGDTVVAALGVAAANGHDLPAAVEFANAAAGHAVEKVGTTVVTLEMLRKDRDRSIENFAKV